METIRSKRLLLRNIQITDVDDIFEYARVSNVTDMVGMKTHINKIMTKEYINHEIKKDEILAIVIEEESKLIGTIALRTFHNDFALDIRAISIVINPLYWGNGYAAEAIKAVIRYAFEVLKVHKILGGHYSFNKQSEQVNKKIGFVYEGTLRATRVYKGNLVDEVLYSLLYRDYLEVSKNW